MRPLLVHASVDSPKPRRHAALRPFRQAPRREPAVACQQPPVVGSTQLSGRRPSRPGGVGATIGTVALRKRARWTCPGLRDSDVAGAIVGAEGVREAKAIAGRMHTFRATQVPRRRGKEARRDAKPGLRPSSAAATPPRQRFGVHIGEEAAPDRRGSPCWSSRAVTREMETGRTRDCDREPDAGSGLRWRLEPVRVSRVSPLAGAAGLRRQRLGLDSAGWSARCRPRSRRPARRQAVLGAGCIGLPRGRATGWRSARCGGPHP